jgi:fused signal recognition particle receptor
MALGFLSRLKSGLARSTQKLTTGITETFTKRKLDDAALEELEELLIGADLGPAVAARIIKSFRRTRFGQDVSPSEIRTSLAAEIAEILAPVAKPLIIDPDRKPFVILMVGVNGTGKTTTIGKLSQFYRDSGLNSMLVAGDTFRAAAVEQLQIWGERTQSPVVTGAPDSDPAGLAFDALARAQAEKADILMIDTAGRLHNKAVLMEELRKIIRVIKKRDPSAPHAVLLTLDATTGQNALTQVKTFKDMVDLTGLIVTKLDGSARAGIVVALAESEALPVHAIGVGEQAADLRPFNPTDFARALVGQEDATDAPF